MHAYELEGKDGTGCAQGVWARACLNVCFLSNCWLILSFAQRIAMSFDLREFRHVLVSMVYCNMYCDLKF